MKIFKIDDKLPNICCDGYDWDITDVVLDPDIQATYRGKCKNPNCPKVCGCGDDNCLWDGIMTIDHDDSIELVA